VIKPEPSNLPPIGIDRGVEVFAALSDGHHIAPINAGRKIADKLAKAQRRLARKTKYSANWRKQKAKISRLYVRVANTRKDFLHNQSLAIAKNHGIVKIERLLVQNMTGSAKGTVDNPGKNVKAKSGLNCSILDQGWGMFATMLGYKLSERGGEPPRPRPRPSPKRRRTLPTRKAGS
jgi:putative transposase